MTLSLIDTMSRQSISGNQPIAATGTIDVYGNVGDVGGVAEKTVACSAPGKVLLRSRVEVATAKGPTTGVRSFGVTTLAQTLTRPSSTRRKRPATPHAAPLSHFLKATP